MDFWDRPSGRPLREIARDGNNHAFLLKALREASGELEGEFYNLRSQQLTWHEIGEWSLIEIAGHLRDRESMHLSYITAITSARRAKLALVDFDALVEDNRYRTAQLHGLLYEYAELRERALYRLYNLEDRQWRRQGTHPYRGPLSLEQIVKEMNEHDLAHLWQVQRLKNRISEQV